MAEGGFSLGFVWPMICQADGRVEACERAGDDVKESEGETVGAVTTAGDWLPEPRVRKERTVGRIILI